MKTLRVMMLAASCVMVAPAFAQIAGVARAGAPLTFSPVPAVGLRATSE